MFLSPRLGEVAVSDRLGVRPSERSSPSPILLRPVSVTREGLTAILMGLEGALEEGLRTIDANIPCPPCGEIDVLATDRVSQLTIIDFATTVDDGLLLRGLGHFDWAVRNMPNVRRMCRGQVVDYARQPRLVLLAPRFSPLLRSAVRQIIRPKIQPVRYHTVDASGCPGILFEPVVDD